MRREWRLVGAGALLAAACVTAACSDASPSVDERQPAPGVEAPAAPGEPASDTAAQTTPDPIDHSTGGVQPAPPESGTITGRIALTGPASGNPLIRMGADPLCARANRGTQVRQETVVIAADGGLANVFVKLDGTFPQSPVPAAPVTIDQENCIYSPRVVGVRVGQTLAAQNSDPLMHNVHGISAEDNGFNVSQPRAGMLRTFQMMSEEMMLRMRCDVHGWMTAYVGVVSHPYFAVSGEDGTFELVGVPPGTYTIRTWHERFGPLTQTVSVTAGAATTVDFGYTGSERPPSAGVRDLVVPAAPLHLARIS